MAELLEVRFSDPEIIGAYSLDGDRQYKNDMSGLKYLKIPNINEAPINLKDGEYKGKTGEYDILERITQMTKYIMDNPDSFVKNGRIDADFICFRGALKYLMTTPYNKNPNWVVKAVKFKGTIYFIIEMDWNKNTGSKKSGDVDTSYQCGFKFESYVLASDPKENSKGSSEIVNENEEFCILMSRTIDDSIKIVFGIESDGVEGNKVNSLDDLKKSKLAEVKCKLKSKKHCDDKPFKYVHYNTKLDWWCQSYIASIDKIQVGFRDNEGNVTGINAFDVQKFENAEYHIKKTCLIFLKYFLNEVKKQMKNVDNPKEIHCFKWDQEQNKVVEVGKNDDQSKDIFLRDTYIDFINNLK